MTAAHKKLLLYLLAGAMIAAGTVQGYTNRDYYLDDSFIVLRIGRNLAGGLGWGFNPGERMNSSTSVLNPLLAAVAHLMFPRHAILLMHLCDDVLFIGAALLLFFLVRDRGGELSAAVAGAAVLFDPLLRSTYGLETPIYIFLALLSLYLYERRSRFGGIALGLLALARPDGLILALVLLAAGSYETRKAPWRDAVLFAAVLAPWLIFSWLYFGSVLPETFSAKMAQGVSGFWKGETLFVPGLFHNFSLSYPGIARKLAAAVLFLPGAWIMAKASWPRRIMLWALLILAAYYALGVPGYHWYYAPAFLVFDIGLGFGAGRVHRWLTQSQRMPRRLGPAARKAAAATALLVLLLPQVQAARRSVLLELPSRERAYREMGAWIKEHTPADDRIAAVEIGTVGYYSGRRVVDPLGLVANPSMREQLARAYGSEGALEFKPELLVIHQIIWPIERAWLGREWRSEYRLVREFDFPDYRNLLLLGLNRDATPPAP